MQDVASPASDADSTKQHSPPGRVAVASLGQTEPAAGIASQPKSDAAAGKARKAGPRKRKASTGADVPPTAGTVMPPGDGDAHPSGAAPGQAAGLDPPSCLQHPAEMEDGAGGASARPAAGLQPDQQLQPRQLRDSRQPADSAGRGAQFGSPKQPGNHPAVSPVQNGRKARPQAGSGHGGTPRDDSKLSVKPEPSASRPDSKPGADAPAAPSQERHAATDVPKLAAARQPQDAPPMPQQQHQHGGAEAPGHAKDRASNAQQPAVEPARSTGDGAAAVVPVGLHHFSSSGTTLSLGKL